MLNRSQITKLVLSSGAVAFSAAAFSSPKTVALGVPGMNCEACPITVKKALQRVDGVEKVAVTFKPREAVVTFDDAKTTVGKLTQATAEVGYPSVLMDSK